MYEKLFFNTTVLLIISAIVLVSIAGAAVAQNQTSDLAMPTNATNANAASANMTLDAAKSRYLSIWNQTEFSSGFSTFAEPFSAAGYGVYKEHGNVFAPGEAMVLYVEPVGFSHKQALDERGNTLYVMNITADYIISDASGTKLQAIKDVPVGSVISHRPNTELFLELTLSQERPFPVGDYTITYVVNDKVSGESFELSKDIKVAKLPSTT